MTISRTRGRWSLLMLVCVAGFLGACTEAGQGIELQDPLPFAEMQAYVAFGCGTLDCHGDEGRPLRIYSETGLRAETRTEPLSALELDDNGLSFVGVDYGADVDRHLALLKPLGESAGGMHHVGDTIWEDTSDPGYLCVRAWLSGDAILTGQHCQQAAAALPEPPP